MKYLKYFLFLLLIIPFMVLAEECDITKITITSMEQNSVEGNTEVITEPTFKDRNINLNLKMFDVGDSITYDMSIKNDSNEDYMIDENTFKTDSDYIEYTLKTKDNSNVVKAKSSKELFLVVTYKNEIDDNLLTNNKFNASNSLKLSLNTDAKKEEISIITTDNVREIKNPITSVSSMLLVIVVLLIAIIGLLILIRYKNKYTKYILIILSMLLIPTVYAICTCNIEVKSTIEIEKKAKLFDTIDTLSKEENSCVTQYEGEVTDEVGKTVNASNVYFDKCMDKRNVIFGGFCWQVIRTTETKGTKLVYNGEPIDGKCHSNYYSHKGINSNNLGPTNLDNEYLYGSSFTYNIDDNSFTLIDTNLDTWSNTTYKSLISKYTCKNTTGKCTTIYNINDYIDNNTAYTSSYIIDEINNSLIGFSPFNANNKTPSAVGYMFNETYETYFRDLTDETYKYGSDVTYDNATKMYTLSGTVKNITSSYNKDDIHYTCWNTTGTCSEVSFIYYEEYGHEISYINLKNGKNIDDAINDMFNKDDLNVYNSSIKGIIDAWYKQNLIEHQSKIEDTVYCNHRVISSLGNWRIDKRIDSFYGISFKYNSLTCSNITDSFSISNNKAKLKYPVALINNEEWENLNYNDLRRVGRAYWTISPSSFYRYGAENRYIYGEGFTSINYSDLTSVKSNGGIRPSISLAYNNLIFSGTGSEEDPWVIK